MKDENGVILTPRKLPIVNSKPQFLIGQRVIMGDEICIVARYKGTDFLRDDEICVYRPSLEYSLVYDIRNVKPLPNGQL